MRKKHFPIQNRRLDRITGESKPPAQLGHFIGTATRILRRKKTHGVLFVI